MQATNLLCPQFLYGGHCILHILSLELQHVHLGRQLLIQQFL